MVHTSDLVNFDHISLTHHPPGVIDAKGKNVPSAQGAKIGDCLAVEVNDIGMLLRRDRGNKTKPDTQGCGQNQALDCRATGNFHDFLSSKRDLYGTVPWCGLRPFIASQDR